MATIGQVLTSPESGWKRYDDADSRIIHTGATWDVTSVSSKYNGVSLTASGNSACIKFKFYGTKLRIIGSLIRSGLTTYSTSLNIDIDGQIQSYRTKNTTDVYVWQALEYEKTDLELGVHSVTITNTSTLIMELDAIDIDDIGYLVNPSLPQKLNLLSMQIGDCIPCTYVSNTSGAVGTFSNLAIDNNTIIPVTSSATPNGLFYWIFVGYDTRGRMKLIADRNIQHSISWDTLNSAGIASGLPIWTADKKYVYTIRLMTGGTSATDTDNEWDKIIVGSNLNGTIAAGDNNVWNWNGVYSLSSTRSTSYYCIQRGNTAINGYSLPQTSSYGSVSGFRPVLLIETLTSFKYLIQNGTDIYAIKSSFYNKVGQSPVTEDMFSKHGADDVHYITDTLTQNTALGTDFTTLGSGKVSSVSFKNDFASIASTNIN